MKQILFFFIFFITQNICSQIVNIPDPNFKSALLNNQPPVDLNNDNEIQVSEAESFTGELQLSFDGITDMTGIEAFINITGIFLNNNPINNIDLSANTNLVSFRAWACPLNSLDISNNTVLENLSIIVGEVSSIDVSNNPLLQSLMVGSQNISSIDVSNNPLLQSLNVGYNNISTVDVSNNPLLQSLSVENNNISSIDISNNPLLQQFSVVDTNISTIDLSNIPLLEDLSFDNTNISTIDVSNNPLLKEISFRDTTISEIDLSNNNLIEYISCQNTLLMDIDLSNMYNLAWINCENNPNLRYINIRNGNNDNYYVGEGPFFDLPNLEIICVDDVTSNFANTINQTGHTVSFTDTCHVIPPLSNQIIGDVKVDMDNDGCDANDISFSNMMVIGSNGADVYGSFTQNDGSFQLYTNEGDFTTNVTTNLPSYYESNPLVHSNSFIGEGNVYIADFCIESNQELNDVNISIISSQARPGFPVYYRLIYQNIGTTILDGSVVFEFPDNDLSFQNASATITSQTDNSFTFNYANLNPFETRSIDIDFIVSSNVNLGDIINTMATINPIPGDVTPSDNVFEYNHTVVGSWDPNDIACLEGTQVLIENIDEYLHYLIRFQNTGTASAFDVIVKNRLDDNLDWSSLQLQSTSHSCRVAIESGNKIEFIFEDINLPDSNADEPNSHGFIAYKIKPKNNLIVGDVIQNKADIYFDLNPAIITNTFSTTMVDVLSVKDVLSNNFSIYPNPTTNLLTIKHDNYIEQVTLYDLNGRVILIEKLSNANSIHQIEVDHLENGIYFIQIISDKIKYRKKFIKK